MSQLIVIAITYNNLGDAREARKALDRLDREYFDLVDAAVVTYDVGGRVDADNEMESSGRTGALIGAMLGAPFALILPGIGLAGPIVGAAGGGLVGKAVEPGVDQDFINKVTQALNAGDSALIFMFEAYEKYELPDVISALRPFKGTVYYTTLSPEGEKALRQALA